MDSTTSVGIAFGTAEVGFRGAGLDSYGWKLTPGGSSATTTTQYGTSYDSASSAREMDAMYSPSGSDDGDFGSIGKRSSGKGRPSSRRHANLYVKNISDRVDELTLRKVFETCGEVSSCCVIRDVSTNKSRGFGFVKFAEVEIAELAIEKFNGTEYAGKVLEVKFANTDGDSDGQSGGGGAQPNDNIYVKGLPPSWSQDDLKSYFSQFGHIVECRLLHANKSTSSGALIRFLREYEATEAVKKANGLTLIGSATSLVVRYAETQNKPKKTQGNGSTGGEDSTHNGAAFREAMPNTGRIPSHDGLSELLSNEEDFAAINVLGTSPTHRFGNLTTSAPAPAGFSSNQLSASGNVCVQNLPLHADDLFLYKTFAPYGAILSAKVIRNDWNGLCSGVAVLVFRRHTDALTAQQSLMQAGSSLNVTVQAQHLPR